MPIVTFDKVEKSFAGQRLFTGASFALDARDHAVLVGRNGSGKTTLLRLVAGTETPDEGRVARARGKRVWLHEQTPELERDRPVRDYLLDAFARIRRLERQLRAAEERLAGLDEDSDRLAAEMADYQRLQHDHEHAGGYDFRLDLDEVVAGLGLSAEILDRGLHSLSGGELTRVTLARALLAGADLLLLDEPTNHLDIDSVEWLERFLTGYAGAYVLVTHDRRLLESVGRRVLAIEDETVATIAADFATYMRERAASDDLIGRRHEQDQQKIAQLQRFYDRFHAKKDLAKRAQAKLTQIERIRRDMVAPRRAVRRLRIGLPQPEPSARVVLELAAPRLTVGGGSGGAGAVGEAAGGDVAERVLVRDLDAVLERGEKVALVGPNGCGKTTLAETIVGLRHLSAGAVHLGHNVRLAYFSQQGRELDDDATVLANVLPLAGGDEQAARGLLGRFLFTADEVGKTVARLSGGERSRLRLLTLLVGDANFLILDEPTNHLDIDAVEALGAALDEYTGTLLLITHDRHLIDTVAGRVLEIHDGSLVNHLSVGRYREARAQRAPHPDDGAVTEDRHRPAGASGDERGRSSPRPSEAARRRRARLRGLEADILQLEKHLGEIDARLAEPATYGDHVVAAQVAEERSRTETELDRLYGEWERAAE